MWRYFEIGDASESSRRLHRDTNIAIFDGKKGHT
jgi:hypothetical protein